MNTRRDAQKRVYTQSIVCIQKYSVCRQALAKVVDVQIFAYTQTWCSCIQATRVTSTHCLYTHKYARIQKLSRVYQMCVYVPFDKFVYKRKVFCLRALQRVYTITWTARLHAFWCVYEQKSASTRTNIARICVFARVDKRYSNLPTCTFVHRHATVQHVYNQNVDVYALFVYAQIRTYTNKDTYFLIRVYAHFWCVFLYTSTNDFIYVHFSAYVDTPKWNTYAWRQSARTLIRTYTWIFARKQTLRRI